MLFYYSQLDLVIRPGAAWWVYSPVPNTEGDNPEAAGAPICFLHTGALASLE